MGSVGSLHYACVCMSGCKEYMRSGTCEHCYVGLAKHGLLDLSQPWVKPEKKRKTRKGPSRRKRKSAVADGDDEDALVLGSAAEAQLCGQKAIPDGWKALSKPERLECLRLFYPR